MRMQLHQLVDACIFAASFWMAYQFRASAAYVTWFNTYPINEPFEKFFWFYLLSIPLSPLVLESQGFYDRQQITLRQGTLWPLFKGCLFTSLGLTLGMFFAKLYIARSVPIWFGIFSFALVYFKEAVMLLAAKNKVGQSQVRRRFILAGSHEETAKMHDEIRVRPESGVEIVTELDLKDIRCECLNHRPNLTTL